MAGDQSPGGGVTRPTISLIAAVARNGVIGGDNRMLWRLSTDLKRLRALTWGKPFIIGRKTFESIGRALPGRQTIVVTRSADFAPEGAAVAPDIEAALALGEKIARETQQDDIFVAGGGEIYSQTIGRADRLFITEVDLAPPGDARFPPIDPSLWREARREAPPRSERDDVDFVFIDYVRAT